MAILAWVLFCFVLYQTEAQDGLPRAEQKNKLCKALAGLVSMGHK